ncbi:Uracil-DNA glycosylase [Smittium mucronatum]|uniref:Uracil-DNA glycosylase n=1 Tax=Smittium mucronatum TaxID=133383 RepID=A0A1R0H0I7_9FUNG|nr:Uracil-DNA glycosylase [Smittium mucronatum]
MKREVKLTDFFTPSSEKKTRKQYTAEIHLKDSNQPVTKENINADDMQCATASPDTQDQVETPDTGDVKAVKKWEPGSTDLSSLAYTTMGEDWFALLKGEFSKQYFKKIIEFLEEELRKSKVIYPPMGEVFSWSTYTAFDDVKVVIIGQDPYHNPGQAHGLAFSVKPGVVPPPSLKNIYQAIKIDYGQSATFNERNGYLKGWADQGVLMLNATLTVEANKPNSHKGIGWDVFTDETIRILNGRRTGLVFFCWGSFAQKKAATIIDSRKHLVLKSVHPSPLSAHRGFFQCHHFRLANEYLEKRGVRPINWESL